MVTLFSRAKRFRMFSSNSGVYETFQAEEHTETVVKARKRCFLTELRTSQPLLISPPPPFCSFDSLNKSKVFITFYNRRIAYGS